MHESNAVLEEMREAMERGKTYTNPNQRLLVGLFLVLKGGQFLFLVGAGR